jgi:hypothetical protein
VVVRDLLPFAARSLSGAPVLPRHLHGRRLDERHIQAQRERIAHHFFGGLEESRVSLKPVHGKLRAVQPLSQPIGGLLLSVRLGDPHFDHLVSVQYEASPKEHPTPAAPAAPDRENGDDEEQAGGGFQQGRGGCRHKRSDCGS